LEDRECGQLSNQPSSNESENVGRDDFFENYIFESIFGKSSKKYDKFENAISSKINRRKLYLRMKNLRSKISSKYG
jgi:hypothetical protein